MSEDREFRLGGVHWLVAMVVVAVVILGGTKMWVAAGVGLGVGAGLMAFRPHSRRTRIGLAVASVVLAGIPIVWILAHMAGWTTGTGPGSN